MQSRGLQILGPQTSASPWPVRNDAAQQEMSVRQASEQVKLHLYLQPAFQRQHHCLRITLDHQGLDSHRNAGSWCQKSWGPLIYMFRRSTRNLTKAQNLKVYSKIISCVSPYSFNHNSRPSTSPSLSKVSSRDLLNAAYVNL